MHTPPPPLRKKSNRGHLCLRGSTTPRDPTTLHFLAISLSGWARGLASVVIATMLASLAWLRGGATSGSDAGGAGGMGSPSPTSLDPADWATLRASAHAQEGVSPPPGSGAGLHPIGCPRASRDVCSSRTVLDPLILTPSFLSTLPTRSPLATAHIQKRPGLNPFTWMRGSVISRYVGRLDGGEGKVFDETLEDATFPFKLGKCRI